MRIMRYAVRRWLTAAVAGVALAGTACQATPPAAPPPQTVTVTAETSTSDSPGPTTRGTGTGTGAVGLPSSWPDQDFPLPPGARVTEARDGGDTGIVLTGVEPGVVAEFYRDALPAAGYRITKDNSIGVGGVDVIGMSFTGHGYNGEIAVVSTGSDTVAISLDKI
jgi:hypothetical protein